MAEFRKERSNVEWRGLTQDRGRAGLARAAGVSDNVIRPTETGRGHPGIELSGLHKIAWALGAPLEEIMEHCHLDGEAEE